MQDSKHAQTVLKCFDSPLVVNVNELFVDVCSLSVSFDKENNISQIFQ